MDNVLMYFKIDGGLRVRRQFFKNIYFNKIINTTH